MNAAKPSEGEDQRWGGTLGQSDSLGLAYPDQTPDIQSQLPAGAPKGPVVTNVVQQSPAAQAGLQPGDVILKVGNTAIVSANQLSVVLKKSNLKGGVRVYIWRDGTNLFTFPADGGRVSHANSWRVTVSQAKQKKPRPKGRGLLLFEDRHSRPA